jgi:hypothetical protein
LSLYTILLQANNDITRVSIAKVVSERLAKGSGRKGFGNGREVRVRLERYIIAQSGK